MEGHAVWILARVTYARESSSALNKGVSPERGLEVFRGSEASDDSVTVEPDFEELGPETLVVRGKQAGAHKAAA